MNGSLACDGSDEERTFTSCGEYDNVTEDQLISFDRQAACRWSLLQIVEQVLPYTNGEEQFNRAFDHLNQVIQATKTKPRLIPLLCHGRRKTSAKNTPGYPPSELLLAHLLEMHFRNWDRREHRTPGSISGSQARGWTREEAQKIEK